MTNGSKMATSIAEGFVARCIPVPLQMALSDAAMKQLKGDVEEAVNMAIQSLYAEEAK